MKVQVVQKEEIIVNVVFVVFDYIRMYEDENLFYLTISLEIFFSTC